MEMITVVLFRHRPDSFLHGHVVGFCQCLQFGLKTCKQLFFRYSADGCIRLAHADVVQLVQVAEHTHLRELGHTCQECKTEITVSTFQHSVKSFQYGSVGTHKFLVMKGLQQRLVVFVHQYDYSLAGLFISTLDDSSKTVGKRGFVFPFPINRLPLGQLVAQNGIQALNRIIFLGIQVQMQNRVFFPLLFQSFDSESFKQFFLSFKISFESRKKKAFPETTGTA